MSHDPDPKEAAGARERRPGRMPAPARAERVTVEGLVRWAREGRLRIPPFQRGLRWDAKDQCALLDSLERGYPVGTLLLWKRPASSTGDATALPLSPPAPTSGDVYLVVDGQQRVATLWEALGRTPEVKESAFVFDLDEDHFRKRPIVRGELDVPAALAPRALPLALALDATTLSEWAPPSMPREARRRCFDVGKRLREYELPAYVIEGDDVEVLREVFDRINSTGKSLARDEVFDALVGSKVVDGGARGLDIVNAEVDGLGFGRLDRAAILKSLEAVMGTRIGKLDPRSLEEADVRAGLARTSRALRAAALFLVEVGVPHAAVLPYELPLVVLAKLFAMHPSPSDRSRALVGRWLWRASLAGLLGGASSSLQQHVDDVDDDEDASVQRLLRRTGRATRDDVADAGAFSAASARGKLALCALWARRPRSLVDGDRLDAAELFAGRLEAVVRPIGPASAPLGATLANRLLHPAGGASPARLVVGCRDEGALASHGISRAARDALAAGDVDAFLTVRADALEVAVRETFDARAEWDRDDSPPVAVIASRRVAS